MPALQGGPVHQRLYAIFAPQGNTTPTQVKINARNVPKANTKTIKVQIIASHAVSGNMQMDNAQRARCVLRARKIIMENIVKTAQQAGTVTANFQLYMHGRQPSASIAAPTSTKTKVGEHLAKVVYQESTQIRMPYNIVRIVFLGNTHNRGGTIARFAVLGKLQQQRKQHARTVPWGSIKMIGLQRLVAIESPPDGKNQETPSVTAQLESTKISFLKPSARNAILEHTRIQLDKFPAILVLVDIRVMHSAPAA